jgi:ATP-dependent Clp protease adaptor protein ClpS
MTEITPMTNTVVKNLPLWNVILLNTDHHTFEFVIKLIVEVFEVNLSDAYDLTKKIHEEGQCIVMVTHKERAELFQEKVKAFGCDENSKGPKEPLPCVIEPQ